MLGIAAVLTRLQTGAAAPLLHLRAVNPHVADLLAARRQTGRGSGSSGGSGKALLAAVPRQEAPGVLSSDGWHSGVSSFAFQVLAS